MTFRQTHFILFYFSINYKKRKKEGKYDRNNIINDSRLSNDTNNHNNLNSLRSHRLLLVARKFPLNFGLTTFLTNCHNDFCHFIFALNYEKIILIKMKHHHDSTFHHTDSRPCLPMTHDTGFERPYEHQFQLYRWKLIIINLVRV